MSDYPALEVLEKRAAACRIKRLPAAKDITRPPGAKQANHEVPPGNPLGAPITEIPNQHMGHDPNPKARIVAMDLNGGMGGSRAGGSAAPNAPNMLPGAST